ncbi:MAG: aldo/keto reductase [Candidatus Neomarinimicrobiota bacterium]
MNLNIKSSKTLNNDVNIPIFGLGTYLNDNGQQTIDTILYALEIGYRHIDTAAMYENEREIGAAIREADIPREEIFVTTKLWNSDHGYDNTLRAFHSSLDLLGLDYVDLYLIHWPVENLRLESWQALEKLYNEGLCKSIGVSNYMERHLEELLDNSSVIPAVNQVEFSPFLYLKELQNYCQTKGIALESYSPLTKGDKLKDSNLTDIASRYNKSTSQILVRWCLQKGVIVIPKSSQKEHIKENADVFDFNISETDMIELDNLNENYHSSWDPTNVL